MWNMCLCFMCHSSTCSGCFVGCSFVHVGLTFLQTFCCSTSSEHGTCRIVWSEIFRISGDVLVSSLVVFHTVDKLVFWMREQLLKKILRSFFEEPLATNICHCEEPFGDRSVPSLITVVHVSSFTFRCHCSSHFCLRLKLFC